MPKKSKKSLLRDVLLVHGLAEDRNMWTEWVRPMQDKARWIAVDLPGFGENPLPDEALALTDYSNYLLQIIRQHKLKNVVIAGHSMGGYAALQAVDRAPQYFSGLVLINSHAFADSPEKKKQREKTINHIKQYGSTVFIRELFTACFADPERHRSAVNQWIAQGKKQHPSAIISALQLLKHRPDQQEAIQKLKVPLQLIAGAKDSLIPLEWILSLAGMSACCTLNIFRHGGHLLPAEFPRQTREAFLSFLDYLSVHENG